ncbi:MAG: PorV/PorQ family protein [Flavobacteriales bacterium]|nr:PorV/PorQ family protein [Flavobacteriales bacterium]
MKSIFKTGFIVALLAIASTSFAGNKDRAGQAGAGQLLINPWARSSGWAGANSASVTGLEATYTNIAGLAFTPKTELVLSNTSWFTGSGINILSFGLAQRVSETSVLGLSIQSMNFGDIDIVTEENPEGGIGTFSPKLTTINLGFAKEFSNSIYGGFGAKVISEGISNAKASGIAFDMGVRYVTGENDNIKFGIALKNVGPKMRYSGDGFSYTTSIDDEEFTVEWRTEAFELPALLNIGGSYDYYVGESIDSVSGDVKSMHRVTAAGNFTSNSFGKDQIRFGLEYGFKQLIMIRAGYLYEQGVFSAASITTFNVGPTAGLTFQIPLNKKGSSLDIDYAYRATRPMGGNHSIGIRVNL